MMTKKEHLRLLAWTLRMGGLVTGSILWGTYGDTQVVEAGWNVVIPQGWVIIDNKAGIQTATGEPRSYFTIKDLNGAPFGDHLMVWGGSPIPSGWVIKTVYGGKITDRYAIQYGITNLNEAPVGTSMTIEGIPNAPIPKGWIITGNRKDSTDPYQYNKLLITNAMKGEEPPGHDAVDGKAIKPSYSTHPSRAFATHPSPAFATHPNPALANHPKPAFATHPKPAFATHPNPAFANHPKPSFAVHPKGDHVLHGKPR
jgi:hypothetical protein